MLSLYMDDANIVADFEENVTNMCRVVHGFNPFLLIQRLKVNLQTDVGSIVEDDRITTDVVNESLGKSFGNLTTADFRPVCF